MRGATFPNCPLDGCTGVVVYAYSIGKGDYETKFYRCPACGELMRGREPTKQEWVQIEIDNEAKRARKRKPTKAQLLEMYRAERERLAKMPQLPVEGWEPGDWFPELKVRQGRMIL